MVWICKPLFIVSHYVLTIKTRGEAWGEVRGKAEGEVREETEIIGLNNTDKAILSVLKKGPSSAGELAEEVGLKKSSGFFSRTLKRLMDEGYIDYIYPESPRHPSQKYKLEGSQK